MALFNCNFFSKTLGYDTNINVIIPDVNHYDYSNIEIEKLKVLYLLHGRGDNGTTLSRYMPLERFSRKYKIAIILPSGEDSYYSNSIHNKNYFDFISKELRETICKWFPLSQNKKDNYIAGVSMGGYGALKIAFTFPQLFNLVCAIYPVTDLTQLVNSVPKDLTKNFQDDLLRVFGKYENINKEDNLLQIYKNNKIKIDNNIKILQYVGKQDFLYNSNKLFYDEISKLNANIIFEDWQGEHTWEFAEQAIIKMLEFI